MNIYRLLKIIAFILSVLSLSCFFTGIRQVVQTGSWSDWCLLCGGAGGTIFLLLLQGYWIYMEEKARGSLARPLPLFEEIDKFIRQNKGSNRGKGG